MPTAAELSAEMNALATEIYNHQYDLRIQQDLERTHEDEIERLNAELMQEVLTETANEAVYPKRSNEDARKMRLVEKQNDNALYLDERTGLYSAKTQINALLANIEKKRKIYRRAELDYEFLIG